MRRTSLACVNCAAAESENAILRDEIQRLLEELEDMRHQEGVAVAASSTAPASAAATAGVVAAKHSPGRCAACGRSAKSSPGSSMSVAKRAATGSATVSRISSIPMESESATVPPQGLVQHASGTRPPAQDGPSSIGGSMILASGSNDGSRRQDDNAASVGAQTMLNYQYFHHQVSDIALQVHDLREQVKAFASGAHHDAQQLIFSALKPQHDGERRQWLQSELGLLKEHVATFKRYMDDVSFQTASQTDCSEKHAIQQLHQSILKLASVCTLARETIHRQGDSDVPTSANLNWNAEPTLLKAVPYAIQALQNVAANFSSALDWSRLSLLRMSALEAKSARLERELSSLRQGVADFAVNCFRLPEAMLRTANASADKSPLPTSADASPSDSLLSSELQLDQLAQVYHLFESVLQQQSPAHKEATSSSSSSPPPPLRVIVDNPQKRASGAADAKLIAEMALTRKKLVRSRFIAAARFIVKEINKARCVRVLRMVSSHLARTRRRQELDTRRQVEQQQHNIVSGSPFANATPILHQQEVVPMIGTATAAARGSPGPADVDLAASWRSQREASQLAKPAGWSGEGKVVVPHTKRIGTGRPAPPVAPSSEPGKELPSIGEHRPNSSSVTFFSPAPPVTFKAFMASIRSQHKPQPAPAEVEQKAVIAPRQTAPNKVVLTQRSV